MLVNEAVSFIIPSLFGEPATDSHVSAFLYWNTKTLYAISHLSSHYISSIVSTQSAYYQHIHIFLHPWIHQSADHNIV